MNSDANKSPDPNDDTRLWDKWLQATGVDDGYEYRVPDEVWSAAWHGIWPDDEETIQRILEEYLDLDLAKAAGYLELVLPLQEQGEAALTAAKNKPEQQRQIKIDADIDDVIKTIRGLGLEPDEKTNTVEKCGDKANRKRGGWVRSALTTITTFVIGVLAGFVGAYNSTALNRATEIPITRSPEIRRAIPVKPEIRKAIPVREFQARTREKGQSQATEVCHVFVSPNTRGEKREQYLAFLKQPKDFVWRTALFFLAKLWLHLDNARLKSEMEELKRKTSIDESGRARQIKQGLTGGRNLGLQIYKQILKDRDDSRKTGSGEFKG